MTGITSGCMSTVAPPFSSASTTCSLPSSHVYMIAVQPLWSESTTTGAHSEEQHAHDIAGSYKLLPASDYMTLDTGLHA